MGDTEVSHSKHPRGSTRPPPGERRLPLQQPPWASYDIEIISKITDKVVLLDAEQVPPLRKRTCDERAAGFRSRNREPSVVVGQDLGDGPIGLLQSTMPASELLR